MFPKSGVNYVLDKLFQDTDADARFKLAKNDPAPDDADLVVADLTEADFTDYASQVTAGVFPPAEENDDEQGETDSPVVTFTAGAAPGAQTIYGVYIDFKDDADVRRLLVWCRFPVPFDIALVGDEVSFRLNMFAENFTP